MPLSCRPSAVFHPTKIYNRQGLRKFLHNFLIKKVKKREKKRVCASGVQAISVFWKGRW